MSSREKSRKNCRTSTSAGLFHSEPQTLGHFTPQDSTRPHGVFLLNHCNIYDIKHFSHPQKASSCLFVVSYFPHFPSRNNCSSLVTIGQLFLNCDLNRITQHVVFVLILFRLAQCACNSSMLYDSAVCSFHSWVALHHTWLYHNLLINLDNLDFVLYT